MANVIILYTGNVASTPLISFLKRHPGFYVPVFEHFDSYKFGAFAEADENLFDRLTDTLADIYGRRPNAFVDSLPENRAYAGATTPLIEARHIVFKWRPFDPSLPGADRFAALIESCEVTPVVLRRRSLIQQALKIYLSEAHYGSRHRQFVVGKMSAEEYAEYVAEQKSLQIELKPDDLPGIIRIAQMFLKRSKLLVEAREQLFGRAPRSFDIETESLFNPSIDADAANRVLSEIFQDEVRIDATSNIHVRKGGLDVEHCRNPEVAFDDPQLQKLESKYASLD